MAKTVTKYKKSNEPTKVSYFVNWKPLTKYLAKSIVTYNSDAYFVVKDYESTNSFEDDLSDNKIVRINIPSITGDIIIGPYYTRSGSYLSTHSIKWIGSQHTLYRIQISGSGSGDYPDGGDPWTSYNYWLFFRKVDDN